MKQFYKLKVYPKSFNGGDRIAVYIFSDELSDDQMKKISEDSDYRKTAFVTTGTVSDFKVRFFIKGEEINLCENSTVAVFSLLRDLNIANKGLHIQETLERNLVVDVDDEFVYIEYTKPQMEDFISKEEIKDCFTNVEFHPDLQPQIIGYKNKELILPIKDIESLNKLMPDDDRIKALSKKYDIIGIHAFSLDEQVDAYGRNFMPLIGFHEACASTTSSVALASYLYSHHITKNEYTFRQGFCTDQLSEILVKLNVQDQDIKSVWAGGSAYIQNDTTIKKFI